MMWFGILENKPPELDWGKTSAWKSFATLYTKPWTRDYGRADKLNIEEHNCFEVRLRGDGRRYDFDIHATRDWADAEATWSTHIYTKGQGFKKLGNRFLYNVLNITFCITFYIT